MHDLWMPFKKNPFFSSCIVPPKTFDHLCRKTQILHCHGKTTIALLNSYLDHAYNLFIHNKIQDFWQKCSLMASQGMVRDMHVDYHLIYICQVMRRKWETEVHGWDDKMKGIILSLHTAERSLPSLKSQPISQSITLRDYNNFSATQFTGLSGHMRLCSVKFYSDINI